MLISFPFLWTKAYSGTRWYDLETLDWLKSNIRCEVHCELNSALSVATQSFLLSFYQRMNFSNKLLRKFTEKVLKTSNHGAMVTPIMTINKNLVHVNDIWFYLNWNFGFLISWIVKLGKNGIRGQSAAFFTFVLWIIDGWWSEIWLNKLPNRLAHEFKSYKKLLVDWRYSPFHDSRDPFQFSKFAESIWTWLSREHTSRESNCIFVIKTFESIIILVFMIVPKCGHICKIEWWPAENNLKFISSKPSVCPNKAGTTLPVRLDLLTIW